MPKGNLAEIRRGNVIAFDGDISQLMNLIYDNESIELYWRIAPHFRLASQSIGNRPRLNWKADYWICIPLWLPLAGIIGWIVIRELRWREKRSKAIAP